MIISLKIVEKGHLREISMKLFQYLTSGLREDFVRISSCPYSESSPHSLEPCLQMDQNFANNFWKRSFKEQKSYRPFQRTRFLKNFFMSVLCKKPPFTRTMFIHRPNFANNFWKGSLKKQSCEIIPNSYQPFWRRRILKNFFKSMECKESLHPRRLCFSMDQISGTIFEKGHPRNYPAKLFQNRTGSFRGEEFWIISLKFTQCKKPHNELFLLFQQCFLSILITFFHFHQIWNYRLQTLSVSKSLKFVIR